MLQRFVQFSLVALSLLLVSFAFAANGKDDKESKSDAALKASTEVDVELPTQSAKAISKLLRKHCKTDKVTTTLSEEKEGITTLVISGESAHVHTVSLFVTMLEGELPTEEQLRREWDRLMDAKRAERAANQFEDAGATVTYDYQLRPGGRGYSLQKKPPGPTIMRNVFGEGFFQDADGIKLINTPISVDDFQSIVRLPKVRSIVLVNCSLDDDHLKYVKGLDLLKELSAQQNRITDIGVAHLAGLRDLNVISLSKNQITGSGFKGFETRHLTRLFLHDNPISNDGLQHISDLTSLTMLGLARTEVSDEGIAALERLRDLTYVCLNGTDVTDDGLRNLAELSSLTKVELSDTKVTDEGVEWLKGRLPNCKVSH